MEHTANYDLTQWAMADRIQMADFNADNAKIDAALKAAADARAAMQTQLNKKGTCSLGAFTYTGTGTYGQSNPTRVQFPKVPAAYIIYAGELMIGRGGAGSAVHTYSISSGGNGVGSIGTTWSGSTVSFYNSSFPARQMNEKNTVYTVLAFYTEG